MRNWLLSLRGFNADGRALGLGLAAAMEKQRAEAGREVEKYLREQSTDRVTPASV
ncbi:hypothetical protein [Actinophytocola oryzae]|uniref:Uncharacterized protein n=1 Tax=Actinophytocola oryzae TaxID=502181 RepID=A0A4R7VW14_9PSEU|nr:hypothetical protein [Actinophytocola oryzae]TDV53828.1 hypothetical protein CLV71_104296 [Actinophytocola oryzae]